MIAGAPAPELTASFAIEHGPLDLARTLFALRQGTGDPTLRLQPDGVWRALRTESGPATLRLRVVGSRLDVLAVGPGAEAALRLAPGLAGLLDDPGRLQPLHPAVAEALRRAPGLRLTQGTGVADALVWVVLAQKVVGVDARRSYCELVRSLGEPAPGAPGLRLPPAATRLAATPYWTFHRCNVERRRAAVVIEVARHARRLDALARVSALQAREVLQSIPGVGEWTAAAVTSVTHGDPDAVPLGDYHVPNVVAYALAGEPRADDARMLELLEPYRGQRGRVVRLLMSGGRGAPRYGPPTGLHDIRGI